MAKHNGKASKVVANDDDDVTTNNDNHYDVSLSKSGGWWRVEVTANDDHPTMSGDVIYAKIGASMAEVADDAADAIEAFIAAFNERIEAETEDSEPEPEPKAKPKGKGKPKAAPADDVDG